MLHFECGLAIFLLALWSNKVYGIFGNEKNFKLKAKHVTEFCLKYQPPVLTFVAINETTFQHASDLNGSNIQWEHKNYSSEITVENSTFFINGRQNICNMTVLVTILVELDIGGQYGYYVKINDAKVGACSYYMDKDDDDLSYKCWVKKKSKPFKRALNDDNGRKVFRKKVFGKEVFRIVQLYHEFILNASNDKTKIMLWVQPFGLIVYENTCVKFYC